MVIIKLSADIRGNVLILIWSVQPNGLCIFPWSFYRRYLNLSTRVANLLLARSDAGRIQYMGKGDTELSID
jgi:hypothetical protein